MRKAMAGSVLGAAVLSVLVGGMVPAAADEEAAARQYRVARRLAAEKSTEAAAALRKVVELAPRGELADDALVEEAILAGAPGWPVELGRLTGGGMARAAGILRKVTEELPRGDRFHEARYRAALLKLEPVSGQDLTGARLDLLAVANDPSAGSWSARARYVASWIDRIGGHRPRAADSLQRIRVDHAASAEGVLARVALAELALQDGEYGEAAVLLQENTGLLDRPDVVGRLPQGGRRAAEAAGAVAVRSLLLSLAGDGRWDLATDRFAGPGMRIISGYAADAASGAALTDRKTGLVVHLDEAGAKLGQWDIPGAAACTFDRMGRLWVAAESGLVLIRSGVAEARVDLGGFASPRALAADSMGAVWILDRKGTRIGRLRPGATTLETVWQGDTRLASLAWDGRRMLALDNRSSRVVEIREGNQLRAVASGNFDKPVALAADDLGRFAVLDEKARSVTLFGGDGSRLAAFDLGDRGPSRVSELSLYPGGGFGVTGTSGSTVYRFR